ncbi:MAG TPA: hypothetical protein VLF18_09285 [Tahibacter sp.]|uniref:sugar dehydrogenase complex small subunit n=1 Tax=Tahibacter sp. TaxID=2056211 RepID=UPI002CF230EE|nr:hypothetical protein [Tahibacter sp.]HSX60379.1 hypothetical protein [Tahibacter sp.]
MASDPMTPFVNLSALLTGITAAKLVPPLSPSTVPQQIFDTAKTNGGATFDQLLTIYADAVAQRMTDAQIANQVFVANGPDVRYLARSIMLAWYLGSWYDPKVLQAYDSPKPPPGPPSSVVISSDAYTQGWVWNVAQAHAMGYSNFTFGYWAKNPPALSDFTGATS